jgi:hypothetical protein
MKELWRGTVELIRRYPVLWLPVIWAALLSYGFGQLRLIILHDVLPLMLRHRSVLGGYVSDESPGRASTIAVLAAVNTNVIQYADVCCYVIALLMTAKMLGRLTATAEQDNPYADISIANHRSGVLLLGLLTYVLALASGTLGFAPILYYAYSVHHLSILTRPYVTATELLFIYAMLAYFATPMALRLLSRPRRHTVDAETISTGRKCSLMVGIAITLLSVIQQSFSKPYFQGLAVSAGFGVLSTVFLALPYIGLFVALSLVVAERQSDDAAVADAEAEAEAHSLREADSEA